MNANLREWNVWNGPTSGEDASDSRLFASISGYPPVSSYFISLIDRELE